MLLQQHVAEHGGRRDGGQVQHAVHGQQEGVLRRGGVPGALFQRSQRGGAGGDDGAECGDGECEYGSARGDAGCE